MKKAVILAAGMGTRLRPVTNKLPKCIIPIKGRPILYWQLRALEAVGVDDILLVLGYKKALVERFLAKGGNPSVTILENVDFATTNNIYSLYLARDELRSRPFLLLNGDVYCDPALYRKVLSARKDSIVPYDSTFFDLEELKLKISSGRAAEILPKRTGKGACAGSTMGMFRLGQRASSVIFRELDRTMASTDERQHWFEHVLNTVLRKVRFEPLDIAGFKWVEIDTKDDISKAKGFVFSRRV